MEKVWPILWELFKLGVIPLCLWLFQRQVAERDDHRENEYTERKRELDAQQKKNTEIQFLMMERIDSLSDLTQMMAKKLHDAGIINGDLEHMNQKYEGLNSDYEKSIKNLALKVLNRTSQN